MTKRIIPLDDFIGASEAARILSKKLGRRVSPRYIYRLKNVRTHKVNETTKLYAREDIQAVTIRQKERKKE